MPFYTRKSTRLKDYDYTSKNYYFVTICTKNKQCIFGTIEKLNTLGKIAKEELEKVSSHYTGIYLDNYIVMPNHIHAIIVIEDANQKQTLSDIVGQYKSGVSRKIRKIYPDKVVWQRSFHDHIIRNQSAYEKIWNYVQYNASKWAEDCYNPENIGVREGQDPPLQEV